MVKARAVALGGLALSVSIAAASPILQERNNDGHQKRNVILGWTDGSECLVQYRSITAYSLNMPPVAQWVRILNP
jgi:hypothetical protein